MFAQTVFFFFLLFLTVIWQGSESAIPCTSLGYPLGLRGGGSGNHMQSPKPKRGGKAAGISFGESLVSGIGLDERGGKSVHTDAIRVGTTAANKVKAQHNRALSTVMPVSVKNARNDRDQNDVSRKSKHTDSSSPAVMRRRPGQELDASDEESPKEEDDDDHDGDDENGGRANAMCGVGMLLRDDDQSLVVERLAPGGPAAQHGGVLKGDVLSDVDGNSCKGLPLDKAIHVCKLQVSAMIAGREGSRVVLGLLRGKQRIRVEVKLRRAVIHQAGQREQGQDEDEDEDDDELSEEDEDDESEGDEQEEQANIKRKRDEEEAKQRREKEANDLRLADLVESMESGELDELAQTLEGSDRDDLRRARAVAKANKQSPKARRPPQRAQQKRRQRRDDDGGELDGEGDSEGDGEEDGDVEEEAEQSDEGMMSVDGLRMRASGGRARAKVRTRGEYEFRIENRGDESMSSSDSVVTDGNGPSLYRKKHVEFVRSTIQDYQRGENERRKDLEAKQRERERAREEMIRQAAPRDVHKSAGARRAGFRRKRQKDLKLEDTDGLFNQDSLRTLKSMQDNDPLRGDTFGTSRKHSGKKGDRRRQKTVKLDQIRNSQT